MPRVQLGALRGGLGAEAGGGLRGGPGGQGQLFLPPNIPSQPRGVVGRQVAKGGSLSRHPPQLAWGEDWP